MANWCTAFTLLAGVPGRLACHHIGPCCSVTQFCRQSSFSLHHVCSWLGICAQNHCLMVEASHHFGPTADIRRGSLSKCLAGYSTRPHHRSRGRPRCPGPSNFCKDLFPPRPTRRGGSSEIGSHRYPVVYRTSDQSACIQYASFFSPLFARNPHVL